MSKLWTFGDSFTAGNGILPDEPYVKHEKLKKGLPWPVILSQKLGLELKNKGMGMFSNDKIIDTIMEDYSTIAEGDIIVIGKTFSSRFDIPNKNRETLMTISPINLDPVTLAYFNAGYNKQEIDYLWQMVELMDDPMLTKRQNFRFDFLKSILFEHRKVRNCIIWDVDKIWNSFESINDATKGEVFDCHWSYQGHRDFATYITEYVKKKEEITKPDKKLI